MTSPENRESNGIEQNGGVDGGGMGPSSPRINAAAQVNKLFIIDHHFALNQIDIIENCDTLTNLVVPDTVLRHLNRKNIQSFHGLRNTLEQDSRQFYYFYNENFRDTFVDEKNPKVKKILHGKGLDWKLQYKVSKVFEWYFMHLQGLTTEENSVYLLTDNAQTKSVYTSLLSSIPNAEAYVIDLNDYIQMHSEMFPELANFMGFDGEDLHDADESQADPSEN